MVRIEVRRLSDTARLPSYAVVGDAGADLCAAEAAEIAPGGGRALIGTGLVVAIPDGHVGLVMPRSGVALRHGVTVLNAPGVIDSGYRGELKVLLVNTDPTVAFVVAEGERIAQLVVQRVERAAFAAVAALDDTHRGEGGFGHTGMA